MIWANAVSLVNARVAVGDQVAESIRFSSRVLSIGARPTRGDTVLDLQGGVVLPGRVERGETIRRLKPVEGDARREAPAGHRLHAPTQRVLADDVEVDVAAAIDEVRKGGEQRAGSFTSLMLAARSSRHGGPSTLVAIGKTFASTPVATMAIGAGLRRSATFRAMNAVGTVTRAATRRTVAIARRSNQRRRRP